MKYTFTKVVAGKFQTAVVHTSDTVVTETTPAFAWAMSMNIRKVIGWADSRGFTCKCCGVTISTY